MHLWWVKCLYREGKHIINSLVNLGNTHYDDGSSFGSHFKFAII